MRGKGHKGFTIIETMLVIAVSGALFVALIFGIQYMISRAKFSDAITGLRTSIQSQYEEVRSGINTRNSSETANICGAGSETVAAGSADCLLIGKYISFDSGDSTIGISYIVGDDLDADFTGGDLEAVSASSPRVSSVAKEDIDIMWSAVFKKAVLIDDNSAPNIKGLAIIRSPISGNVITYTVIANAINVNGALNTNVLNSNAARPNISTAFIIENPDGPITGGAICIGSGSSSANVSSLIPVDPYANYNNGSPEKADLEERCQR